MAYGKVDFGAAEAEAARMEGKTEVLKLREGRNVLRFLPPPEGRPLPFHTAWVHWLPSPDGPTLPFACARTPGAASSCRICVRVQALRASRNDADQKLAKDIGARRQIYTQVVDLTDQASADKGVQVYGFGPTIYEELMAHLTDPTDRVDFTDPDNGYLVIIDRKGTKLTTEYRVRLARQKSPIQNRAWLDDVKDLAGELPVRSSAEGAALLGDATPPPALPAGCPESGAQAPAPAPAAAAPARNAMDAAATPEDDDGPDWFDQPGGRPAK